MKLSNKKSIFIFTILLFGQSCSENNNAKAIQTSIIETTSLENSNTEIIAQKDTTTLKTKNKMTNQFPFIISNNDGQFTITIGTESPELYPKYAEFFEKYQYSGNGYCWEGHIIQILERLNPELLKHINFDSEGGAFFAIIDTKENQTKFIDILNPILSDLKKLEEYVKKADHSRIDD